MSSLSVFTLLGPHVWHLFIPAIVLGTLAVGYWLTDVDNSPVVIKNLDTKSFLDGCEQAATDTRSMPYLNMNPHTLLGYKVGLLMSSHKFLMYHDDDIKYVSVTVGDSLQKPHVIFKYSNRMVDARRVEDIITRSCCLVKIQSIKKIDSTYPLITVTPG